MQPRILTLLLSVGVLVPFATSIAKADLLVFTVNGTGTGGPNDKVIQANTDGTGVTTLWENTGNTLNPRGIAYDANSSRVFFSEGTTDRSIRSVPIGGGATTIAIPGGSFSGATNSLAIDSTNSDLFVTQFSASPSVRTVSKMELDGSGSSTFYSDTTVSGNSWLTIDSGFLYFSNNADILRRPLDGSAAASPIVTASGTGVRGLAVVGNTIYWLNDTSNLLNSQLISGGPIVTGTLGATSTPQGLATDGSFLYYSEAAAGADQGLGIYRTALDFTGRTRIIPLAANEIPQGITFVAVPEPGSLALALGIGLLASRRRRR